MNIVIFGASGFVGSSIAPYLISKNYSVTLISRTPLSVPSARCITVKSLFDVDLYYNELLSADSVIYLSGLAHTTTKNTHESLNLYMASNYYPLAFVAQLSASLGVNRFLYFSTAKVLGEFSIPGLKFTNLSIPNPSNAYSYSKYCSEQFLSKLSKLYQTDFVILRPPLIYGDKPKGNIRSLLQLIKLSIPLPLLSLSSNARSMLSLDNLNKYVSAILEFPRPINSSLLISDGDDFSTLEFVKYISKCLTPSDADNCATKARG